MVWRIGVACTEGLHIAGDLATGLNDDFAIAYFAVHPPAGADNKSLTCDQITVKAAADFGFVNFGGAFEKPARRNFKDPCALQGDLNMAFDD